MTIGDGNIVPGLEDAPTGKVAGDRVDVVVTPEQGYGLRDERLVQVMPHDRFPVTDGLAPGQQFHAEVGKASREELTHGHVHGPGGHEH